MARQGELTAAKYFSGGVIARLHCSRRALLGGVQISGLYYDHRERN